MDDWPPNPNSAARFPRDLPVPPKPTQNHERYILALRRLGPEGRLRRAFELTERMRALFRIGLRQRFPDLSEAEFQRLYLERLAKCHNRNY